jgi:phenylacetate-CoA ligase
LQHDNNFLKKPFLFIIAFGMGIWSAGMGIYTGAYLLSNSKNLPMSIISPGVNITEVIKILRKLGKTFKQIIIAGYPPFVKDIIDEIKFLKIDVRDIHFKFIFTGEAFPEELRDYIYQNLNVKNIFIDTMNTYGTSELGATGIETPLSIFIKRKAYENQNLFESLFGDIEKTPTLVQYIPYFVNIECVNGELLYTADSSIPLVRYASGDHGGVLFFDEMINKCSEQGMDLKQELKKVNLDKYTHQLPFSYVYERKNMATTLYGLLIYPEFIKTALFDKELTKYVTGRFVMATRYDKRNNQYLEINIELQKNIKPSKLIERLATKIIVETLRKRSSEYRELSNNYKEKVWPKVILWPYGYEKYFNRNLNKQKWILR